jgi:NifU-like protein involved in Fe-S cluster formation
LKQSLPTEQPVAYSPAFKDHIANPRNAGELPDANATGEETNPVCGDRLRLSLRVCEDRIEAARFLAYGCAPTLVCGSVLTELIIGKTVAEALVLTRQDLVEGVGGLPSRKQHAAALAIEALHSAIESKTSGGKPTFPT